jgi:hypothetical protein
MRVVIFIQENHTTDNYFRGLAPWGANVATDWPICKNPPPVPPFGRNYPRHERSVYYQWLTEGKAEHSQFDTANVLPYYLYLAVTGAFLENHCAGFGTNSTPNHLLLIGGQSPTLKNPYKENPVWDMPSLPGLAGAHGVSWRCYVPSDHYPIRFYEQLQGSKNIVSNKDFIKDATEGKLPELVYVWHNEGADEHPPADLTIGEKLIWQSVDAVVKGGGWEETVFMLTWDDWGGFDDHVRPPVTEYTTPDNVQLAYGPRVPLLMFGGRVKPGIDSRWNSHVAVPRTAQQLLGLPALGVPRLDQDPGLADLVDQTVNNAPPPAYEAKIEIPAPPEPTPPVKALPPPPVADPQPVGKVVLRNGEQLPAPNDQPLPKQPAPPHN